MQKAYFYQIISINMKIYHFQTIKKFTSLINSLMTSTETEMLLLQKY